MNYIRKHWRGEYPLLISLGADTFLLACILITAFMLVPWEILDILALKLSCIFMLIVYFWQIVGVCQSIKNLVKESHFSINSLIIGLFALLTSLSIGIMILIPMAILLVMGSYSMPLRML